MIKFYKLLILFIIPLVSYSQGNDSFMLFDSQGRLNLDTATIISNNYYQFFTINQDKIVDGVTNHIVSHLPLEYATQKPLRMFHGVCLVSFMINKKRKVSDINLSAHSGYMIIRNEIHDIDSIIISSIISVFQNNRLIDYENISENDTIFLPLNFSTVEQRDTTVYYTGVDCNSIYIKYNMNSSDYYEFSETYKNIDTSEFAEPISFESNLDYIIPDTLYVNWEYRVSPLNTKLPPFPRYIKTGFIFKKYEKVEPSFCAHNIEYVADVLSRQVGMDSVVCSKGFFNKSGLMGKTYSYILAWNNSSITKVNTVEMETDFLGRIDNLYEALFLVKLNGYSINASKVLSNNEYEFIATKSIIRFRHSDKYIISVNENGIVEEKRLGTEKYLNTSILIYE